MARLRALILLITILILTVFGVGISYYARGYRLDTKNLKITPRGLLVADSDPNGAQVYIDGELETATNATIDLVPGTYDVRIQKEGFITWEKRLIIQKEIVTKVDATLFPTASTLTPLTFSGALNPVPSQDFTKLAYGVPDQTPQENGGNGKAGLWVTEVINLPIGFTREPRQITDGDVSQASWVFSPDAREIMLTTDKGVFLLDVSTFTAQNEMVNITSSKDEVLTSWQEIRSKRLASQLSKLPDELESILERKATNIIFSPDRNKILFTASGSAEIPEKLIKQLPGASTQKQARSIENGKTYVYDIKEDRNFEVAGSNKTVYWLPTSAHILIPENEEIVVKDYDGTNRQAIYSGAYESPHAYSFSSGANLLILTNLGANSSTPNLYSFNLK